MKIRTDHFNFGCRVLACLWLLLLVPFNEIHRPAPGDFVQFYMGGAICRAHQWSDLYPIPHAGSTSNPGNVLDSDAKPGFTKLAYDYGVVVGYHFIQPPPVAMLMTPLTLLDFEDAHFVWIILAMICAMLVALQAGWIAEICFGRPTLAAGIITVLVGLNLTTYRAIRMANVTPMVAALLGWTVLDLLGRRNVGPAVGIVLSSVLKYAGAVFLPILIVMHQWKTIALCALFSSILCGATIWCGGAGAFKEYLTVISPTLSRSRDEPTNQSLEGMLSRITRQMPITPGLHAAVNAGRWLTLAVILFLIVRGAADIRRRSPQMVCASCAAMVSWLMFFSPICWENYMIYLMPLWGWLTWEAVQGGWRRIVAPVTIVITLVATQVYPVTRMREPFNSHFTLSLLLTLCLAIARLIAGESQNERILVSEQPPHT